MQKLTIKDIARMANVSPTTVSFVLNNKEGIGAETAEKVRKVCKETGFVLNVNSRRLLQRKSFNINLVFNSVTSDLDGLFYYDIMKAIVAACRDTEYNIVISYLKKKGGKSRLPDSVYTGDSDGLIFLQSVENTILEEAKNVGIPYIFVDAPAGDNPFVTVSPDYEEAIYKATAYMIEQGHRDIGFLTMHTSPLFHSITERGFLRCMSDNGLVPDRRLFRTSAGNEVSSFSAMQALLSEGYRPTAMMCAADILAIGAMQAAKQAGLSVPEDMSFIGVDDIVLASFCEPKLTTMTVDKTALGQKAFDSILAAIEKRSFESVILPTTLIKRDSVASKNL